MNECDSSLFVWARRRPGDRVLPGCALLRCSSRDGYRPLLPPGAALDKFIEVTATDEEDALGDLLLDLMHWSDRNNYDFDAALDRARFHYEAETTPEPSP